MSEWEAWSGIGRDLPLAAIIPASADGCPHDTQCELKQVVASQHSSGIVMSIMERRTKRRHPTKDCECGYLRPKHHQHENADGWSGSTPKERKVVPFHPIGHRQNAALPVAEPRIAQQRLSNQQHEEATGVSCPCAAPVVPASG